MSFARRIVIKFLALAYTAEAELILASDPHLTDMQPWRVIPIIPPGSILSRYQLMP